MKKTYLLMFALMLTMLGISDAMAQKIYKAELNASMFKAWDSPYANASEAHYPDMYGDYGYLYTCENNLYKEIGAGGVIMGNTSVYYLFYADITGTRSITFKGSAGMQLRVLMNRSEPEDGGDSNGGSYVEKNVTIGDDGVAVLDVTDLEYVHLNCIKCGWGSSNGIITSISLEGAVRPVSGILSVINNGNAEGDDLSNFYVSLDGPNNGDSAPDKPEIVAGEGVDGSKCFKVTAFDSPTETWHSQLYLRADEVMLRGSKWKLKMAIKADQPTIITTSAQAQPRAWKGSMGIDEFGVSTEWQSYEWTGEIGVDDFQSIGFDLSNEYGTPGNAGVSFYFDNIEFGYDLGAASPLSEVNVAASYDVIRVDFGVTTNLKDLVKASPSNTLVFDNSTVSVDIDGEPIEVLSVEGYEDGNLYIFIEDDYYGDAEMKVAFRNPEDDAHRLVFTSGNWEGEAVPEFSGIVASFDQDLGNAGYVSYLYAPPALLEISPEAGSFNLPGDLNEFTVTFNQPVKIGSVFAMLDEEFLIVSGEYEDVFSDGEAYTKIIKLTRSLDEELSGSKELIIYSAEGKAGSDFGLQEPIVVKYSFGPVDASAKAETIYASNFTGEGTDANGAGWKVTADNQAGMQDANSGSGNRLQHGKSGFAADVLYLAQRSAAAGIALYGTVDDYKLTLEGGKTYHLTLKSAQWDAYPASGSNRSLRAQVLTEEAVDAEDGTVIDETGILAEEFKAVDGRINEDKEFTSFDIEFTPEADGNFVIRLVVGNSEGNPAGFGDGNAIADVKVQFIPDVLGIVETQQLADALQSAKDNRDAILTANAENEIDKERYSGEDLTALSNLIADIEANMSGYTAPSVYVAKSEELAAAVKVANDHKTACDTYDTYIKKAIDIVTDNAENKFCMTETYKQLESIVMRYNGFKFIMQDQFGEEEDPIWITNYMFDVLTDNAELNIANAELSAAVALGEYVFTEVALDANIQQGNSGVAVLVERNRLGARTLMSLGVEESDPLIQAVKNSVTDDDKLAEDIKARIKTELYSKLKETENDVFGPQVDEFGDPVTDDNGEFVNKSYDMTVFIKNPNIYEIDGNKGISEENLPGWYYPTGSKPGDFKNWDGGRKVDGLPEDIAFTTYFGTCRMEQTITDLPAGIYVVSLCGSDWSNQAGNSDNPHDVNSFVYCKTSETPEVAEGEEEDLDINFAAVRTIVYGGQWNMDHSINLGYAQVTNEETGFVSDTDGEFFGIPVVDGKLTLGMHFAGDGQFFFQHVKLTMVAPLEGFDYAAAYNGEEPIEEWVDIIINGDMEEESTECFYVTEQGWGGPYLANITDGIGTDGSRAIVVQSAKNPSNSGDSQFFIRLPYQIPAGTPYRVTFDYKATQEAYYTTQAHGEPGSYIYWRAIGNGSFENYWQTYEMEGVVTSDMSQDGNMMQTIAFSLAEDSRAIQYIFDNIKFEVPASVLESLVWNPAVDPNPYPMFKMGDVNADREVNITDVVLIIEDILEREPQNYNAELADVNYDGWIDVSDVVMVIDAILGKVTLSRGAEPIDRSAYTAFQMDLTIPAGYVLESVSLTDIAKDSHSLAYTKLPDGRCRVVVCSMNNEALPGAWDEVIRLNLRGQGDAQVNVDRAVFVTIDGERHELMMNPTSIAEISTLNSQTSNLYDLQGRKVEKNAKGILIENGRKTVIK